MRLLFFSISILSILALTFACQQPEPTPIESGVSKVLADHRKATITNVEYELEFLIPDNLEQPIKGIATIKFDLENTKEPVVLDFENPLDQGVVVLETGEDKTAFSLDENHIIIPTKHLKEGQNSFTLTFRAGEQALNRNGDFLYTLFVPNKASTAFPCFD